MLAAIEWVRRNWLVLLTAVWAVIVLVHGHQREAEGYKRGLAEGQEQVKQIQLEAATQARLAAETALAIIQAQVKRANDAEARLLERETQLDTARQQLKERIPHVTTVYRPAPAATPVAIPHCVFTRGWLRDFNAALGAGLPAAGAGTTAAAVAPAASPAPGSDAELLESGVSPADILAYAQDYGRWSLANLKQLQELLALQVKEPLK